jgi:hypothetical protein
MSVRSTARSLAAVAAAYALVLQTTLLAFGAAMATPAGFAASALCSHPGDAKPGSLPRGGNRGCRAACLSCCYGAQAAPARAVFVVAVVERSLIATPVAAVAGAPSNPACAHLPRGPPLGKN